MSNFKFLEKINKDLYSLGNTAEKLFRDEYFDQCITQTRKMAEVMTKDVLGNKAQSDDTFDDMIYKLKTISCNNLKEQEFISDMYFLKKQGNIAVHSIKSENSGKIALECLEHAFEASINYASSRTKDEMINLLIFDEKLLVLGEKNQNLQTNYKNKIEEEQNKNKKTKKEHQNKKIKKQTNSIKSKQKNTKNTNQNKIRTSLFTLLLKYGIIICFTILSILFILQKISAFNINKQDISISLKSIKTNNINNEKKLKIHNIKKTPEQYSLSGNFSNK